MFMWFQWIFIPIILFRAFHCRVAGTVPELGIKHGRAAGECPIWFDENPMIWPTVPGLSQLAMVHCQSN